MIYRNVGYLFWSGTFQKIHMEIPQIQKTGPWRMQLPYERNFLITDQSKLTEAAQVVPWLASMPGSYWCNRLDKML